MWKVEFNILILNLLLSSSKVLGFSVSLLAFKIFDDENYRKEMEIAGFKTNINLKKYFKELKNQWNMK